LATRHVTYEYPNLTVFLKAYEESISKASLFLPAGAVDEEVANEFKLDIIVPMIGRQGPIPVQVVHRGKDGSLGLHLPEIPVDVKAGFDVLFGFIGDVRDFLVESQQMIGRTEYNEVIRRLAQAETRVKQAESTDGGVKHHRGRGIPIPDVSAITPALSGQMTDRSLRDAMVSFAVERSTGMLKIEYPDGVIRYGFWLNGGPVGWRTDPMNEEEVLGVLLYKAEQITKEQVAESLEIMKQQGSRQGEALVEMGVIDFTQLIRVLSKQTEFILQQVMSDRSGEWSFFVLSRLPEQFMPTPVRVPSIMFRALYSHAREMNFAQLDEKIQVNMDRYLSIDGAAAHVLNELQLSKKEKGFIEVVLSSSWRLREVFSVSPLGRGQTSAFVWALDELGLLLMNDQEDESRTKARVGDRIQRKKMQLRGTHFDVIEVHWVCLKSDINDAYKRLKAEFHDDRFSDLDPFQVEAVGLINTRLDEAYKILENDTSRRRYRAEVIEKDSIINSAEMLGKQGEMAIMRRDRREACGAFTQAAELLPSESSYRDGLRRATTI
jgi:hypothetical protein